MPDNLNMSYSIVIYRISQYCDNIIVTIELSLFLNLNMSYSILIYRISQFENSSQYRDNTIVTIKLLLFFK